MLAPHTLALSRQSMHLRLYDFYTWSLCYLPRLMYLSRWPVCRHRELDLFQHDYERYFKNSLFINVAWIILIMSELFCTWIKQSGIFIAPLYVPYSKHATVVYLMWSISCQTKNSFLSIRLHLGAFATVCLIFTIYQNGHRRTWVYDEHKSRHEWHICCVCCVSWRVGHQWHCLSVKEMQIKIMFWLLLVMSLMLTIQSGLLTVGTSNKENIFRTDVYIFVLAALHCWAAVRKDVGSITGAENC